MILVTLTHPNGQREEVLLAGVPRKGESIRLIDGTTSGPALIVEHVLWMQGGRSDPEPTVMIVVRQHSDSGGV